MNPLAGNLPVTPRTLVMPVDDQAEPELPPFSVLPHKAPDISVERRSDGVVLIRSNHPPAIGPRSIAHLLEERAAEFPDRNYIRYRLPGNGPWAGITYREALRAAEGIAQWLLQRGLTTADSVMVLSANSVEHALIMLGCYTAGVPVAPISPAYSLISADHAKLKHCVSTVRPRIVFAQCGTQFARAFATLRSLDPSITLVTVDGSQDTAKLADLIATEPNLQTAAARESITHQTVAKYLFTSGSTGMPKAVPQTHGMMSALIAGTEGIAQRASPAPTSEPMQVLEWMPWSHISAGNISFNGVLWTGGTLFLDEGKPLPEQFATTINNLYEVSPTIFGTAPIALSMLAAAMERDPKLRRSFFKNLRSVGYGGATLSSDVAVRIQALAIAETGMRIPLTTMYGATETQGVTMVHWITERVGLIGLPLPGVTLKLVPNGSKYEVRAKGTTITTGYHNDPEKTRAAFDEEGFYRLGDAARFLDPENPIQGLVFDGRVTEDFKLDSGTWVSVGTLRPDIVASCSPYVFDAVITGENKPFAAALLWPAAAALAELARDGAPGTPFEKLQARVQAALRRFNATAGGSSRRISRFTLMTEPPSIDAGEITDKGYVNQRATLEHRAPLVELIYAGGPGVVSLE
jgi:feruloyl-CoA synthase